MHYGYGIPRSPELDMGGSAYHQYPRTHYPLYKRDAGYISCFINRACWTILHSMVPLMDWWSRCKVPVCDCVCRSIIAILLHPIPDYFLHMPFNRARHGSCCDLHEKSYIGQRTTYIERKVDLLAKRDTLYDSDIDCVYDGYDGGDFMIHRYYLLADCEMEMIISRLDHIRTHSMDRSIISDDCDVIETLLSKLRSV